MTGLGKEHCEEILKHLTAAIGRGESDSERQTVEFLETLSRTAAYKRNKAFRDTVDRLYAQARAQVAEVARKVYRSLGPA